MIWDDKREKDVESVNLVDSNLNEYAVYLSSFIARI